MAWRPRLKRYHVPDSNSLGLLATFAPLDGQLPHESKHNVNAFAVGIHSNDTVARAKCRMGNHGIKGHAAFRRQPVINRELDLSNDEARLVAPCGPFITTLFSIGDAAKKHPLAVVCAGRLECRYCWPIA